MTLFNLLVLRILSSLTRIIQRLIADVDHNTEVAKQIECISGRAGRIWLWREEDVSFAESGIVFKCKKAGMGYLSRNSRGTSLLSSVSKL